jgi:hypothetical protein
MSSAASANINLRHEELHGLSAFALEGWPRRHDEYEDAVAAAAAGAS